MARTGPPTSSSQTGSQWWRCDITLNVSAQALYRDVLFSLVFLFLFLFFFQTGFIQLQLPETCYASHAGLQLTKIYLPLLSKFWEYHMPNLFSRVVENSQLSFLLSLSVRITPEDQRVSYEIGASNNVSHTSNVSYHDCLTGNEQEHNSRHAYVVRGKTTRPWPYTNMDN